MHIARSVITLLPAMVSLSLSESWWFKIVVLLYMFGQGRVPVASCELVPAMFDPETKQVIYNPEQTRTEKKKFGCDNCTRREDGKKAVKKANRKALAD